MSKKSKNEQKGKWEKFSDEQETDQQGPEVDAAVEEPALQAESARVEELLPDGLDLDIDEAVLDFKAMDELRNQVKSLEMQIITYRDQATRAAAEVENTQRRAERDVINAHKYGNEKLITELLPIIDSMVRAKEGVDTEDTHAQSILEGMGMTLELLETTLAKFGLKVIAPESGEAFNPDCHEAMSMVPNPDLPKNSVMQLLQKGYELNGRVLRAAMVMVTQ